MKAVCIWECVYLCIFVCLCISLSVYNCVCVWWGEEGRFASVHEFVFQYVSVSACLCV